MIIVKKVKLRPEVLLMVRNDDDWEESVVQTWGPRPLESLAPRRPLSMTLPACLKRFLVYDDGEDNDDDEDVYDDDVVHDDDDDDNDDNNDLQWTEILHWSSIPELGISSFLAWRHTWKANFKPLSHHHNVTFQQKWIDNFINDHKWSVSRLNPIFWGKGQPRHNQRYHNIYDHHHPV